MLNRIVRLCDERYQSHQCKDCSYGIYCPKDCEKCLEYIHYPQRAPVERKYDCTKMMDYYVCKYAYKYTSELIYAFSWLRDLRTRRCLNVLSIGCGPCTDLMALNYLKDESKYNYTTIDYRGVEINTAIWSNIHDDISNIIPSNWSFDIIPEDICNYIDILLQQNWKPDLIVLQYVFSDMHKTIESQRIETMIASLAQYIDSCDRNTYVVCNDINLSIKFDGGREYFDSLYNKIRTRATPRRLHFDNRNRSNHFEYGDEYDSNDLIIEPGKELTCYNPFMTCASAQMIIKKEE